MDTWALLRRNMCAMDINNSRTTGVALLALRWRFHTDSPQGGQHEQYGHQRGTTSSRHSRAAVAAGDHSPGNDEGHGRSRDTSSSLRHNVHRRSGTPRVIGEGGTVPERPEEVWEAVVPDLFGADKGPDKELIACAMAVSSAAMAFPQGLACADRALSNCLAAASADLRSSSSAFDGLFNHSLSHRRGFHLSDSARISGHLQGGVTVLVGVVRRGLRLRLLLEAQQAMDLRQRRQHALFRPALNLLGRQLQHLRQLLVSRQAQPGAQRALAHAAVDQLVDHSARHILHRLRTENSWEQLEATHRATGCEVDLNSPLGLDGSCSVLPLGDKALSGRRTHFCQQGGERRLRQALLFSVGGDVHTASMSGTDSKVNSAAIGKS
nr:MAG TPA: hypothetical protein [Caudoviricetes sp.]